MRNACVTRTERARAAPTLARSRWGTRKVDGMIRELGRRTDELWPVQRAQLKFLAELVPDDNNDETDGAA